MPINPSLKALVTSGELAAYLAQTIANLSAEQADAMQRLINAVSAAVEMKCKVPLIKAAATEYYDGGRARIMLRRVPVDTVAALTVFEDGVQLAPAADGSSKTAAGGAPDFWLDPATGILERNGIWLDGHRIVRVPYTAGVARQITTAAAVRTAENQVLTSVDGPEDLREACLIICKAHTDLGPSNFGVQFLDGGRVLRADAWPRTALQLLEPYTYPR